MNPQLPLVSTVIEEKWKLMDCIFSSVKSHYTGVSTGKTKAAPSLPGYEMFSYIYGVDLDLFSFMNFIWKNTLE